MKQTELLKKQLLKINEKEVGILLASALLPFLAGRIFGWPLLMTVFIVSASITITSWYLGKIKSRFENIMLTFLKTFGLFAVFSYSTVWFGLKWGLIISVVLGLAYRIWKVRFVILLWWNLTKDNIKRKWRQE